MMQLTFLGTGSAFCLKNYHPNYLIETNNKRMLIDAGGDIRFSLLNAGYSYKDIQAIYITHLHNDHIGGMEFLAISTYFDKKCKPIDLFCHKILVDELWFNSLKGGLSSIQGKSLSLQDYFNITTRATGEQFMWEGLQFEIIQSIHIFNGFSTMPTFGLIIYDPQTDKTIFHTSDTQFIPELFLKYYQKADMIIQDCETSTLKSSVHAHYDDIKTLDPSIKAKMFLWHYQDNVVDQFEKWQKKAHKDGFRSFLKKGEKIIVDEEILHS